jgi:glycosyltransferase involved in cell wall biosynthesis
VELEDVDLRKIPLTVLVVAERADRSRYFESALPELRDRGAKPVFVSLTPAGPIHAALSALGIPNHSLRSRSLADYVRAARPLARLVRQVNADLVHAHEAIPAVVAACAGGWAGTPVVFHRHHDHVSGPQRLYSRLASKLSQRTIAVSNTAARAAVTEDSVACDRVSVTLNGVARLRRVRAQELLALRHQLGLGRDAAVIVAVARFRREKGLNLLIRAASQAAESVPDLHLVLVGDGPIASELRTEAARAPVAVHFPGFQHDIAPWYELADVVVVPSRSEACPLVAIEALSVGKPVVATSVGGLAEVLGRGTGILVPPSDTTSLARAIARVLTDKSLAQQVAQCGHESYAARFTIGSMVEGWLDGYRRVLR